MKTTKKTLFVLCLISILVLSLSTGIFAARKEISVMTVNSEHSKYLADLVDEFKEETGLDVVIDIVPSNAYVAKLQMVLSTQSSDYDVIYIHPTLAKKAIPAGWLKPLDSFLNDPSLTDEDFDFEDFYEKPREVYSNDEGVPYAVPNFFSTFICFYNREMFEENGLDPDKGPESLEELREYAEILNQPEKGYNGIALRAKRESAIGSASWIALWLAKGGMWYDRNMVPLLDKTPALEATELWVDLLKNYAPLGVGNYNHEDIALQFTNEKIAMTVEDTNQGPVRYSDPAQSKIAGKIGYSVIYPIVDCDEFIIGHGWGFGIPTNAANSELGWKWIQFATSKDTFMYAARNGFNAGFPRKSVWQEPELANYYDPNWIKTAAEALNYAETEYTAFIPEGQQLREEVTIAITNVLSGQATIEEAMKEANENCYKLLEKAGYYD